MFAVDTSHRYDPAGAGSREAPPMIESMIVIVAVCGALAAFAVLTIVLRVVWLHPRLPRDFPRAWWRSRKRKRGAAKRPVRSDSESS